MKKLFALLTVLPALTVALAHGQTNDGAARRRRENVRARIAVSASDLTTGARTGPWSVAASAADTFILAKYSFDDVLGPSAQGWTSFDRHVQDTFWHVASAAELDGGDFGRLTVLQGNKSMWCGAHPNTDPNMCGWGTPPGYGNGWRQHLTSKPFARAGDVTLAYVLRWDMEPAILDILQVTYLNKDDTWTRIMIDPPNGDWYDWIGGPKSEHFVIPDSVLGDSVQFRFSFISDGGWSDEDGLWPTDGAVILDSLVISDSTGVLSYQDFEAEPDGAVRTDDGHWQAVGGSVFGDFAALYPGVNVLQEDPCVGNISTVWGFFSGSPDNYACGGHTEQLVVPSHRDDPMSSWGAQLYMENEIWSPYIDWTRDVKGSPVPTTSSIAYFEFDVYRDLPIDNLVFYLWYVRGIVDGCRDKWRTDSYVYWGEQKDWFRHRAHVAPYIPEGATQVQLALRAEDFCDYWCGIFGTGQCHSHAPMFDNVRLVRINVPGPSWEIDPSYLLQDNFASDGTLTGTVRMDVAAIKGSKTPRDSMTVKVHSVAGLDRDGNESAVYCHVKDVSPAKSGTAISGDPDLWPAVSTAGGWTVLRLHGSRGGRFDVGLSDNLYTPGDTILYYFSARDTLGNTTYSYDGGVTTSEIEARAKAIEVTCLPANAFRGATDILYIDDCDGFGAQPYFDTAFEILGITPDRYDVRDAARTFDVSKDGPGSRVSNVMEQLGVYRKIIWNSGFLNHGLIGDGVSGRSISDDFGMLLTFVDQHPDGPGLYISGSNIAEEWHSLSTPTPATLKHTYMNFRLVTGDHTAAGEPVSPLVIGAPGFFFDHPTRADSLVAYDGCTAAGGFDVLASNGPPAVVMTYSGNADHGAVLAQVTPNSAGDTARVVLSGFSYSDIRDDRARFPGDRVEHLLRILRWMENGSADSTAIEVTPRLANNLAQNFPNPFNTATSIRYSIEQRDRVTLRIYDVAGRLVRTLVDGMREPTQDGFAIEWGGRDNAGNPVSSGVYFYRLSHGDFSQTRKMVLLR